LLDSIRKIQNGEKPMMVLDPQNAHSLTGPPAIDGIGPTGGMDEYWKEADATRRKNSAWAA
jgi:hypothetical protein